MNITEICIRRPVLAWMLMAATIVFGIVAARRIGVSQMPDVDFPTITVNVTREGAAPEVIETDVIEPLEDSLSQVEGLRSLTATARQGSARLIVELDLARDVDLALQDVQSRVSAAQRRLPRDIDPPTISKTNPEDQPILWIGVSGPYSRQKVTDVARYQVRDRLQLVPGVGEISLGGYAERNVRIWVDAVKLEQRGLTIAEVIAALEREHLELPAGLLESAGREIGVRVLGEALTLDGLKRLVLRRHERGAVHLEDVALVEDGFEDIRNIAKVNGVQAQGLGIRKQRGANTVKVAQGARAALEEIRAGLPQGMHVDINFDSSRFVEDSVRDIEHELFFAILLTALVCWMFLGSFSSTLNVILAIPMSLFGTVAVIYFLGFTLNTFTLLALSLAVGIVVDDAIMVMENVFRHHEEGKDPVRAALEGTNEIKFSALAATLAVCAIFLPVVFMEGIIGRFFFQFGVTLSLAVLFSYVEAITLAPARCAQFLGRARSSRSGIGAWVDSRFESLSHAYARSLGGSLRRPGWVLLGAAAVLGASVMVFKTLPSEFVPSQDQGRILLRLQTAVGSSLAETTRIIDRAQEAVSKHPEVTRVFAVAGGFGGNDANTGRMFVTLREWDERKAGLQQVAMDLRKELSSHAGLKAVMQDLSQQGFTAERGFPVEFSLRGGNWDLLTKESERVARELEASAAVTDVDTDFQLGQSELRLEPNRSRATDLGVSASEIAGTVNALVGGVRVGRFNAEGRRVDIRVRLLSGQRTRPEQVSLLKVRTQGGDLVPLSTLLTQEERPAALAITRKDRERAVSVYGNVAPGASQEQALATVATLTHTLPDGVRLVLGGASEAFQESMDSLLFALLLGVLVAYMVLAAQFNSFLHPITVLTILPLSVAGASFALLIAGKTLNIFSMIGVLLLMGIVKKNSIVLVDYARRAREAGASAAEAMQKAGATRLRPILMTSIATGMAAIPAAMALGQGSETRAPMAISVLGGLLVSTVLSLYVVPAFYVLADRASSWVRTRGARHASAEAAAGT